MNNLYILLLGALALANGCSYKGSPDMVFVEGGTFINTKSNLYGKNAIMQDFCLGKYEVTQREWVAIMGSNPSEFRGDSLPVEMVSWYDCIEYCNQRSIKEGLIPYYTIDKNKKDPNNISDLDSLKWIVTIHEDATGYRLPTEAEWEYAAGGGRKSNSYIFSGSHAIDEIGWYWRNSGDTILTGSWFFPTIQSNHCRTKPVGLKKPNELGLHDMSGNVREWCDDWYEDYEMPGGFLKVQRGGGWLGAEDFCLTSYRDHFEPNGKGPDQGFRVCRSALR